MKGSLLSLLFSLIMATVFAQLQPLSVNDFQSLASLNNKNTGKLLDQKGFRTAGSVYINGFSEYIYAPKKNEKTDSVFRSVSDFSRQSNSSFTYKTSSPEEYDQIVKELQQAGFWQTINDDGSSLLFQKKDFTITCRQEEEDDDTLTVYKFSIVKSVLPEISGIHYAEDLARFTSHENLAYTFGEGNVVRDEYFFDEDRLRKCTVLYPNTSRQVIFIWKDEAAMKDLACLVIGGSLRTNGSVQFNQSFALSDWVFKNGIRLGMKLAELKQLNRSDFEIYGAGSEFQGTIVPSSKGDIDFKNTGLQFGCLNCYGDPAYDPEKITATAAIDKGLQLYLVSVLLMASSGQD